MTAEHRDTGPIEHKLIKAHCLAAVATLLISIVFGSMVSMKFHSPDAMASEPWMTWGRLRYNHTQGIFFGWLGNAFLMFLYHAVPKLAGRPVLGRSLGWVLFVLWNFAVLLPGWLLVSTGSSQPLEWAEFPLVVDALVVTCLILMTVQFVVPLLRARLARLYVSGWYILGAIVFTLLAYPVGNVVPELVPGAQGAAFSGLWIHDAIGLWVTPLALSIAYFVVPAVTGRPIYSHFLSMLGFWLLFFVYPLNGTHHYVFSAIPMEAQHVAIAASAILGIDVILVVANLLLSMRGAEKLVKEDYALRFVHSGIILYLIVSIQGSLQAFMPLNKLVHFSDWVIGHSHLAMLGFATFTAIGGMVRVWQQIPGTRFSEKQLKLCYWHLLFGLILMVGTLSLAGLTEAQVWQSTLPWLESVRNAKQFWFVRTLSGVPIGAALFFLVRALTSGAVCVPSETPAGSPSTNGSREESGGSPVSSHSGSDSTGSAPLSMAYASALIAGVGFFVVSFLALAVVPGQAMVKEIEKSRPPAMLDLTTQEEEGRRIYSREGCAYCHTQQVRKVPADVDRFGAATRVWETIYDYPQLWGTRRIGPDLARESKVRPDDWQYAHLFNARLVTPDSVMPPYAWLFAGDPQHPLPEARALVAYIRSLGRERELAGFGRAEVPEYCLCPQEVKDVERTPVAVTASASMARPVGEQALLPATQPPVQENSDKSGADIFARNCAGCHGDQGRGDGPAAAALLPPPADLTMRVLSAEQLNSVMINGVYGSAMPAWRDLPPKEMSAVKQYVLELGRQFKQTKSNHQVPNNTVADPTRQLFARNCASCHGTAGDGNGPAAATMAPRPTNFQQEQPSTVYALRVITEGVPGTSMPPWQDQLSNEQRQALAQYVCSLYQQEKSP